LKPLARKGLMCVLGERCKCCCWWLFYFIYIFVAKGNVPAESWNFSTSSEIQYAVKFLPAWRRHTRKYLWMSLLECWTSQTRLLLKSMVLLSCNIKTLCARAHQAQRFTIQLQRKIPLSHSLLKSWFGTHSALLWSDLLKLI